MTTRAVSLVYFVATRTPLVTLAPRGATAPRDTDPATRIHLKPESQSVRDETDA